MKYFAILDTDFLQYFRIDMPQKCDPKHFSEKVLVVKDEGGCTRGLYIKPLIKPLLINPINGESAYLTQGHIDALIDYEQMATIRKFLESINTEEI